MKARLDEQKSKFDLASRELDVTQREYRLRAAVLLRGCRRPFAQFGVMGQGRRRLQKENC